LRSGLKRPARAWSKVETSAPQHLIASARPCPRAAGHSPDDAVALPVHGSRMSLSGASCTTGPGVPNTRHTWPRGARCAGSIRSPCADVYEVPDGPGRISLTLRPSAPPVHVPDRIRTQTVTPVHSEPCNPVITPTTQRPLLLVCPGGPLRCHLSTPGHGPLCSLCPLYRPAPREL